MASIADYESPYERDRFACPDCDEIACCCPLEPEELADLRIRFQKAKWINPLDVAGVADAARKYATDIEKRAIQLIMEGVIKRREIPPVKTLIAWIDIAERNETPGMETEKSA